MRYLMNDGGACILVAEDQEYVDRILSENRFFLTQTANSPTFLPRNGNFYRLQPFMKTSLNLVDQKN